MVVATSSFFSMNSLDGFLVSERVEAEIVSPPYSHGRIRRASASCTAAAFVCLCVPFGRFLRVVAARSVCLHIPQIMGVGLAAAAAAAGGRVAWEGARARARGLLLKTAFFTSFTTCMSHK